MLTALKYIPYDIRISAGRSYDRIENNTLSLSYVSYSACGNGDRGGGDVYRYGNFVRVGCALLCSYLDFCAVRSCIKNCKLVIEDCSVVLAAYDFIYRVLGGNVLLTLCLESR